MGREASVKLSSPGGRCLGTMRELLLYGFDDVAAVHLLTTYL